MSRGRPLPRIAEPPKGQQSVAGGLIGSASVEPSGTVFRSTQSVTLPIAAPEPACRTCKWWHRIDGKIPGTDKPHGHCRGAAPVQGGIVNWPITSEDADCPVYSKREKS